MWGRGKDDPTLRVLDPPAPRPIALIWHITSLRRLSFPLWKNQGHISAHCSFNQTVLLSARGSHLASYFEGKCRLDMFYPRGCHSGITVNTRIVTLKTFLPMLSEAPVYFQVV